MEPVQIQCVSSVMSVCIKCDGSALQDMYDADDNADCVSSMMLVYIQCDVSSLTNTFMMRNLIPGGNV